MTAADGDGSAIQWSRVLVMDADLQHPPETAAALAQVAMRNDVDIVAGTRYASSASSSGLASSGRGIVSAWSTRLAKSLFPYRLAGSASDERAFAFRWDIRQPRSAQAGGLQDPARDPCPPLPGHGSRRLRTGFAPRYAGRSKAPFHQDPTHLGGLRPTADLELTVGGEAPLRQGHIVRTVSGQGMLGV